MRRRYSVWCGIGEVNDYLLTRTEAKKLAQQYIDDGYDDVVIDRYTRRQIRTNFLDETTNFFVEDEKEGVSR